MTIRLKPSLSPSPSPLFSWENVQSTPLHQEPLSTPQSPPTQWLSARDMKIFGPEPMRAHTGISECKDCKKPVLNSAMGEHAGETAPQF